MRKKIFSLILIFSAFLSIQGNAIEFKSKENDSFVLMYHRLSENADDLGDYTITPESFEEDIKYLLNSGYTICSANAAKEMSKDNKKICVITFDDGYLSDYLYALPILKKYRVSATFFVIGKYVGQDEYMTEEMIYDLSQSPYAEIGNHSYETHTLPYEIYRELSHTDPSKIAEDFKKNSSYLSRIVKKDIVSASYPYGVYNTELNLLLQASGLTTLSSDEAPIKSDSNPIPRYNRPNTLTAKDIVENKIHPPVKQKTFRYPYKLDYIHG